MELNDKTLDLLKERYQLSRIMNEIGDLELKGVTHHPDHTPSKINDLIFQLCKDIDREIGYQVHQADVERVDGGE